MPTLGAIFLPTCPPERLVAVARTADRSGLEQLWLWEDCFQQTGPVASATALAATERLRVGVGVMPVPLRNPALLAMEIANLARLHPGRFVPGLGHGVQNWMAQVGARAGSPLTLLGETLAAVRALLRGENVTVDGRYVQLQDVRLDHPPSDVPRVVAAAAGPKTLEVVGRYADGVVLDNGTTPDGVRAARERIDAGRTAAGRTDDHEVIVYVPAATGPDARARLQRLADATGHPVSPVGGTAADVAAAIELWFAAGADTVVLRPTDDDPDLEAFAAFVGADVRPLLT